VEAVSDKEEGQIKGGQTPVVALLAEPANDLDSDEDGGVDDEDYESESEEALL
jgi:hypothetical protein